MLTRPCKTIMDDKKGTIIGVDAGGVCFESFIEGKDRDQPIPGAAAALKALRSMGYRLILISFAGKKTAVCNARNIEKHFPDLFEQQIYVKDMHAKIAVCAYYGISIMIDDTPEVLDTIRKGYKLGKADEIKGQDVSLILFTEDKKAIEKKYWKEQDRAEGAGFSVAECWDEIVAYCKVWDRAQRHPNLEVNFVRFVYSELCVPPIKVLSS
jgi:ribonucleotide monophosphatase NagD (HAD superfamily)